MQTRNRELARQCYSKGFKSEISDCGTTPGHRRTAGDGIDCVSRIWTFYRVPASGLSGSDHLAKRSTYGQCEWPIEPSGAGRGAFLQSHRCRTLSAARPAPSEFLLGNSRVHQRYSKVVSLSPRYCSSHRENDAILRRRRCSACHNHKSRCTSGSLARRFCGISLTDCGGIALLSLRETPRRQNRGYISPEPCGRHCDRAHRRNASLNAI